MFWVVWYKIFPVLSLARRVTLFTLGPMKIYQWQVTGKLCQPKERIVAGAPYDTRKYGKLPKVNHWDLAIGLLINEVIKKPTGT